MPLPDVERTRALRAVELVAGDGQQVAVEGLDVDRHLAHGLYRVGVEVDVGLAGDNANLRHWLEGADLVVGHHHRDELRGRSQCTAHVAGIDCARAVDGEECDFNATLAQPLRGMEDGVVLDRAGDDVVTRSEYPSQARLSPSVPPLVKTTSAGRHPSR